MENPAGAPQSVSSFAAARFLEFGGRRLRHPRTFSRRAAHEQKTTSG